MGEQDLGPAEAVVVVESPVTEQSVSFAEPDHVIQDASEPAAPNTEEPNESDEASVISETSERLGTISSARFNIMSTMVGGGSLSLPFAFQKAGNGLVGPLLLILIAFLSVYCFKILIECARRLSPVSSATRGSDSFESITSAALGEKGYQFSMALVTFMCFFGTIGYAVLLRDMLVPVTDLIFPVSHAGTNSTLVSEFLAASDESRNGPTWKDNLTMWIVVLLATPLCTLQTLTALKKFGAASMFSVLILGLCILFRSSQCILKGGFHSFQLWPDSFKDLLDAFPLFVSCFVCHYNIPTVHNELRSPTPDRVKWWLESTVWMATGFYLVMGLAGSAYGQCTESGKVSGNILLDFPEDDPLLLVGRLCLAMTLTLAFPMLTIPARDIIIRLLPVVEIEVSESSSSDPSEVREIAADEESMREPLLSSSDLANETESSGTIEIDENPFMLRLWVAMMVFWSATAVASCVSSIDIVWDLLGSSLSMLLSYLLPCGSYIVLSSSSTNNSQPKWLAWLLLIVSFPLMIVSTANAIYNTFFQDY